MKYYLLIIGLYVVCATHLLGREYNFSNMSANLMQVVVYRADNTTPQAQVFLTPKTSQVVTLPAGPRIFVKDEVTGGTSYVDTVDQHRGAMLRIDATAGAPSLEYHLYETNPNAGYTSDTFFIPFLAGFGLLAVPLTCVVVITMAKKGINAGGGIV